MAELYDISVPINSEMHIYHGNPATSLARHESIADGADANVSRLELGVHSGTHIDGPLHFIDGAAGTEVLPLDAMIGPAEVVDATAIETDLDEAALRSLALGDAERVLLKTKNSQLWALPEFTHDFIRLTGSGARYVIDHGVRLIGIDYLSIGDIEAPRRNPGNIGQSRHGGRVDVADDDASAGLCGRARQGEADSICTAGDDDQPRETATPKEPEKFPHTSRAS